MNQRLIQDDFGVVSRANARRADMIAALVARGVPIERATAKATGDWSAAFTPTAPSQIATPTRERKPASVAASRAATVAVYAVKGLSTAWAAPPPASAITAPPAKPRPALPRIADVLRVSADAMGVSLDSFAAPSRCRLQVFPRQVAVAMCRRWAMESWVAIGHAMKRDHTTMLAAGRVVMSRIGRRERLTVEQFAAADKACAAAFPEIKPLAAWWTGTVQAKLEGPSMTREAIRKRAQAEARREAARAQAVAALRRAAP